MIAGVLLQRRRSLFRIWLQNREKPVRVTTRNLPSANGILPTHLLPVSYQAAAAVPCRWITEFASGGRGTMLVLFPVPALAGLSAYGVLYLVIRSSNVSCGIGGAIVALALGLSHEWLLLGYAVFVFLIIPAKQAIDAPRRRAIEAAKGSGV